MAAYASKDLDIVELKSEAQKQWEERDFKAAPDLALMTRADIHGARSEQQLGRETLIATQSDLQEATGMTTLSDESRQLLLLSVSFPYRFRARSRVCLFLLLQSSYSGTFSSLSYLFIVSSRSTTRKSFGGSGNTSSTGESVPFNYNYGRYCS